MNHNKKLVEDLEDLVRREPFASGHYEISLHEPAEGLLEVAIESDNTDIEIHSFEIFSAEIYNDVRVFFDHMIFESVRRGHTVELLLSLATGQYATVQRKRLFGSDQAIASVQVEGQEYRSLSYPFAFDQAE